MNKYIKKPIPVKATRWWKNGDHPEDGNHGEGAVVRYYHYPVIDGALVCCHCGDIMRNHGWIDTLEGGHIVCPGDWILTGIRGEHWPVKPDTFAETYDKV